MYRCRDCGEVFETPSHNSCLCYFDGFPCVLHESVCPHCGGAVEVAEECEYCDGYKRKGADMCDACHENLMTEVAEYLSQYDATELAAINQQMDGVHIGDFMQQYGKKG